jgi:molybdate transport system substrate-binding protein
MTRKFAVALAAAFACFGAAAAEIKVISSIGMKAVLEDLKPQFEQSSGHKLAITFGTAVPLKRQIDNGETFDVAILTPPLIADLAQRGMVGTATVVDVAKSGLGVAIAKGAARPNLATADAFRKTLSGAKSIAYTKEGQSGVAMARVVERLGLTDEMKPRTLLETRSGGGILAVAEGKAEMGFALVSEIAPDPSVDYAGPLPAELQSYVTFTAGVSSAAANGAAGKDFVDFLRNPKTLPVLKMKGMDSGASN